MTLYEYSQLGCVVETLFGGVSLLLIGNLKVKSSRWFSRAKQVIALVFILVGIITLLQFQLKLNVDKPLVNTALNITMLYTATLMIATAFIPLANRMQLTRARMFLTLMIFLLCVALVWVSPWCDSSLATILIVSSLALYLIDLLRIIFVFAISYKKLVNQSNQLDPDERFELSYLNLIWRCVMLLSLFALLYAFLVMWSDNALAIFNFASLVLWAYVFITVVNMIINYPDAMDTTDMPSLQTPDNKQIKALAGNLGELDSKLDRWISTRAYCHQGITITQVAKQLGTNRTYLSRYINSNYGCNFNTWLTRLRIEEAKNLLVSSPTLTIEKISQQTGFTSKSQFMRNFKAQEGITPGQWREQYS